MEQDLKDLFGNDRLRELWGVFLAVTTRTNPAQPFVMRKRELVKLMHQCHLVVSPSVCGGSHHGVSGNGGVNRSFSSTRHQSREESAKRHPLFSRLLLEAEVNIVHNKEASRSLGRKFVWSAFLRSLVTLSRKCYRSPGIDAQYLVTDAVGGAVGRWPDASSFSASSSELRLRLLVDRDVLPRTAHLRTPFRCGYAATGFHTKVLRNLLAAGAAPVHAAEAAAAESTAGLREDAKALVHLLARFEPALRELFAYFAGPPTPSERSLGRHLKPPPHSGDLRGRRREGYAAPAAPAAGTQAVGGKTTRRTLARISTPAGVAAANQHTVSLAFPGWLRFCSAFNVATGSSAGALRESLTNADLATVFYSSIAMECVDDVGGLTLPEFLHALVHAAALLGAGKRQAYVGARVTSPPALEAAAAAGHAGRGLRGEGGGELGGDAMEDTLSLGPLRPCFPRSAASPPRHCGGEQGQCPPARAAAAAAAEEEHDASKEAQENRGSSGECDRSKRSASGTPLSSSPVRLRLRGGGGGGVVAAMGPALSPTSAPRTGLAEKVEGLLGAMAFVAPGTARRLANAGADRTHREPHTTDADGSGVFKPSGGTGLGGGGGGGGSLGSLGSQGNFRGIGGGPQARPNAHGLLQGCRLLVAAVRELRHERQARHHREEALRARQAAEAACAEVAALQAERAPSLAFAVDEFYRSTGAQAARHNGRSDAAKGGLLIRGERGVRWGQAVPLESANELPPPPPPGTAGYEARDRGHMCYTKSESKAVAGTKKPVEAKELLAFFKCM